MTEKRRLHVIDFHVLFPFIFQRKEIPVGVQLNIVASIYKARFLTCSWHVFTNSESTNPNLFTYEYQPLRSFSLYFILNCGNTKVIKMRLNVSAKILSFISIKDIYDKNIITKEVFRISTDFVEYYISDPRTVTLVPLGFTTNG